MATNRSHGIEASSVSQWLVLRVFYVRVSKCGVDDYSTPESLKLNHTPLDPHATLLEVNGVRSSSSSTLLRRDRVDKKSEEATFVSTDSMRMSGSVRFEVFSKDALVLSGILLLNTEDEYIEKTKGYGRKWRMLCESHVITQSGSSKGKRYTGHELIWPIVEVYVAGSSSGAPIILTKCLQPCVQRQSEGAESCREFPTLEAQESPNYDPENEEYNDMYPTRSEFLEAEESELSWFNAGVRVGVGISLSSMCLGIGIGVGFLVRTYREAASNFRRRRRLP